MLARLWFSPSGLGVFLKLDIPLSNRNESLFFCSFESSPLFGRISLSPSLTFAWLPPLRTSALLPKLLELLLPFPFFPTCVSLLSAFLACELFPPFLLAPPFFSFLPPLIAFFTVPRMLISLWLALLWLPFSLSLESLSQTLVFLLNTANPRMRLLLCESWSRSMPKFLANRSLRCWIKRLCLKSLSLSGRVMPAKW